MDEIITLSSGAQFVRADLHIHSFGAEDGSFDVTDTDMTPDKIVDTAIEQKLSIISITDHNEITNSRKAIEYSQGRDILVIPGIEVSTTQGHLLVYFERFEELRAFYGKLSISDDKQRCSQGILECLNFASQYNGIGILAHIELDSGFEKAINRFSRVIEDILSHKSLFALEISNKSSFDFYTDKDSVQDRVSMIKARRKVLNLADDHILPKVMSSDSHSLNKLGKNAEGNKKLTRIKIDDLSFQAFKNALILYESRIRLEDLIPQKIPYFYGLSIKGGILDGQQIKLSKNLTCIIGGRGTGKSTLLETIRECSGNSSTARIVDSEVWPEEIDLFFEDETSKNIHFKREKNSIVLNITDSDEGIQKVVIDSYGQGETADTIQHSDDNPKMLLNFLDTFIDIKALTSEDNDVRNLLLENQSSLNKARLEVAAIEETKRQILNLDGKKKRLEQDKVGDLVKHQIALIAETGIRKKIIEDLKGLISKYREIFKDNEVFTYFKDFPTNSVIIGNTEFIEIKKIVEEFSTIVANKSQELNDALNTKMSELNIQLKSWKGKEAETLAKIEEKKTELEKSGIPFDLGKINQIAKDLEYYNNRLRILTETDKKRIVLEGERKELIKRRVQIRNDIYRQRHSFSLKINDNLKNSVDGFFVKSSFSQGLYSPTFEVALKQAMDWRTVTKAEIIASNISPLDFCNYIRNSNPSEFIKLKDSDERRIFSDADINNIIQKCKNNYCFEEFEALEFEDRPSLQVTKIVKDSYGKTKNITKSIAKLSLGQQQSILLAILIHSESTNPLLIDQPEDNLDSEFIYKTIVTNLRKIKEKRQVIIVTHNANIAVLGDAELIIPLKSTSVKSQIISRGSIDKPDIRNLCCDILEGGKRAFNNRQELYGIKL